MPTVERVWRQVNRLSDEVEQVRRQVWELIQAQRKPPTVPDDEDVDPDLRALVGIDPPLLLNEERKELRRILAKRRSAG
jgi:hypothetical protein